MSTRSFVGTRDTCVRSSFRGDWLLALWLALALFLPAAAEAQTAVGTQIDNVATASYLDPVGNPSVRPSNLDRITVVVSRTPSTVEFLKYGLGVPGAVPTDLGPQTCSQSATAAGPFVAAPPMTDFMGNPIDLGLPVPLVSDGAYHAGEPVFIRVEDQDQNLDPATVETVLLTLTSDGGDSEILELSENGPNTGVFYGYIMSATPPPIPGDCRISVAVGETILAEYTDVVDGSDASSDVTLVDPFGIVFDSASGTPVDGATITLIDVLTGNPAAVVGDDGLSSFPATIVSGGSASDSSGRVYDFEPGRYRFPFVRAGRYALRVTPPATHAHPSATPTALLQSLPGAPFAIVPGSRGEDFVVPVGPAVQVDIPLDPISAGLLVTKQAGKQRVGAGEFVPYRIRITNSSGSTLVGAELLDRLPARFRYEDGSGERVGVAGLDPTIARNGQELTFVLGDIASGETVEIGYVARVVTGAKPGEHVNRAFLTAQGGIQSNVAEASVEVEPDLFDQRSYLLGRIHIDACELEVDEPAEGLGNVKVYLEDGSFVVTDDEGRFHFEAIAPGLHVVQLDLDSIPEEYEPFDCGDAQRRAGRAFSEFVELQPGTLWRSDFHVRTKRPREGRLAQTLAATMEGDRVDYRLTLSTENAAAEALVAMVQLPEDVQFLADSATLDGEPFDISDEGGMLLLRLSTLGADERREIRFSARVTKQSERLLETRSILRARASGGGNVMTDPALLKMAAPLEDRRVEVARDPLVQPDLLTNSSPAISRPPAPVVLEHRLLGDIRKGLMQYVLQIYVDEELPDVILAEVDLPEHLRLLEWTPRNELGQPVTSTRVGERVRFILPEQNSRNAVRVFLRGDVPQRVLQVFFSAKPIRAGEGQARSRILPSYVPVPAAPAAPAPQGLEINGVDGSASSSRRESGSRRMPTDLVPGSGPSRKRIGMNPQDPVASIDGVNEASSDRSASPKESRPASGELRAREIRQATTQVAMRVARQGTEDAATSAAEASSTKKTAAPRTPQPDLSDQRFDADWLESAAVARGFAYPEEGALPRIPSLKLGIAHEPDVTLELRRNDQLVHDVHLEGRSQNKARTLALSRYRGVGLEEGENRFVAIFRDRDGNEVGRSERMVHLSGAPVRARIVPGQSTLVADGRTAPVLALQLFDRFGQPVRAGSTGQFELDPPYQTEEEVEAERNRPLAGIGFERPSFVVEEDGIARIRLNPTSLVGEARLRFQFREGREDEILAWLEPGDRDWVLVGLATGTVGWNNATGSAESRRVGDADEGVYTEGRVAFFAKGRVPGQFLLTAAYDSDASNQRLRDRLFQTLDPNEHYTLYGDTTQRDFDAPTSGRLYVKIERKRFFALYGDYQTGLEETELSRYARSLTGAKLEYQGEHFEANAFVTDSDQSFVRDEILGDGTSGLYRLSRTRIVPGSESITIETRDRFRPELVLSSEPQARFGDYDIDYNDGTLFFRRPISRQDSSFNPIFIVIDYETNDRADNAVTGGGRVAGKVAEGRVEIGFTGVHEGGDQIESQLLGADATFRIADQTELRAEFAHSRGDDFGGKRSDEAWLVEVDHRGEALDLRAYAREQGEDFGLGQQRGTNGSLRSYGVDAGYDWTQNLRSETSVFRQENLATDARRHVAELRSQWETGSYGLNAGVRYSGDETEAGSGHQVQVLGGGRANFFDGLFSLRAEGEAALAEDQFGDFPHRATLGADWNVHERLTVFVDQELSFGDEQRTADTRGGLRGAPWKGANVTTSVVQETREFGPRTYANLGLQQRFDVATNWGFDVSVDRTQTIRDPGNSAFNQAAPAASGSFNDDYTAVSVGTAYRQDGWSGTGRLEARFGESEDRWGFVAGLLRDENRDLSWSARFDLFYTNARSGSKELQTDTSLSLAYRPLRSAWIVLDRLDFQYRDNEGGDLEFESRKLLHHLKINQLAGRGTQFAWQLSNKLVIDTIDRDRYTNFGTLVGVEMRRDFARGFDMSLHARARHQTSGDEVSYGYGLSVGRILVDNVWLSLGYNLVGFYDDEFSAADYTAQGPYFRIRAKFDQLSVKDALQLFR